MSDLGWRADGIERAEAAGGVTLEVYRRPGFTGGQKAVRPATSGFVQGFDCQSDPDYWEYEDGKTARRSAK